MMLQRVLSTIREFSMIERGDSVLVAVSGGPDSVVLLHVLRTLRDELGITLHVAHLDHSLRGEASDEDAEYVHRLADEMRIPVTIEKTDVPQIQRTLRMSPEEAARLVRYEFLNRVADEVGATRIALGHTADDQVETVLMNILRGAGVDGLRGMPPVREKIMRPFINIRRSEIEEYLRANGLRPRTDETNLMPRFTRNRIRLELLPILRRDYNPAVDSAVIQLAELARSDVAYLNLLTRDALDRLTVTREAGMLSVDADGTGDLPDAVARRLVRMAAKDVSGDVRNIGVRHVDDLLDLVRSSGSFRYELPGGILVERSENTLTFFDRDSPGRSQINYAYALPVPGEVRVSQAEAIISSEARADPIDPLRRSDAMAAVFDLDSVVGALTVRNWRAGDRIRPLGMSGSKKLQDIFVDGRVPRCRRHRILVLADEARVLWVAGLVVSDEVKVKADTRRWLVVSVRPESCGEADCLI